MLRRLQLTMFMILLLGLVLGGCGDGADKSGSSRPVVVASPQPVASLSPTVPPPRATQTPLSPDVAPSSVETATLTAIAPALATATAGATAAMAATASGTAAAARIATATMVAAPSPLPPSPMPTSPPLPTATPTPTVTSNPIADPAAIRLRLQPVVSGLERPLGIANAGDGSGRLFVLEQVGRIRIVRDGALASTPYLDITDRVGSSANEQGLLGLAFHPDYAGNGLFFVNYTDRQGDTVVARFSVSADPDRADPASGTTVLSLPQPAGNHNGGHLAFGPDGYLYIGTGDGGGAGDQYGNGQNGGTLLGAMLRLDVDGAQPYAVPAGNPFIGDPAVRDEIWATGLRNPWRYSFDRLTGDLYIADVGQNQYEEVNFQQAAASGGQNYGWPIMEGQHCYPKDRHCTQTGLALPVAEYDHSLGCSVTGGYVYRGREFPVLAGIYLFGDYCSGRLWGLAPGQNGAWQAAEQAHTDIRISSFGEDEAGELYLLDMDGGVLLRITAGLR